MALIWRHGGKLNEHGMTSSNELMVLGGHVGTHVDAFCHLAVNGKLVGGEDAHEASRAAGFNVPGWKPWNLSSAAAYWRTSQASRSRAP